ncbi:MAG: hypothetical protein GXO37_05275, partial [Chloroflexi bacterium]|nr:hypothetical protein [Chloroflexota bacterium]
MTKTNPWRGRRRRRGVGREAARKAALSKNRRGAAAAPNLTRTERVVLDLLHQLRQLLNLDLSFRVLTEGRREGPDGQVRVLAWGPDMELLTAAEHTDRLEALRLLVQLMASHRLGRRVNLIITEDVEQTRRAEELRQMAEDAARTALETGRPVPLPPMPAHERRVIHVTLHHRSDVETKSQGKGPQRHVVVYPRGEATASEEPA